MLCKILDLGATAEGATVPEALRSLPELIERKKIRAREVDTNVVTGSWRRLVPASPDVVHKAAYVFCVLE